MKIFFFILTLIVIFICGFFIYWYIIEWYFKRYHKKNVNRRIKEILFKELGFTYRETSKGRGFLIIDEYKKNKAIRI